LIGCYLCLSSSVYFFAKRQQERRSWRHALLVAGVFALLFIPSYVTMTVFFAYKMQLEHEARSFGDEAFRRVFAEHDSYFFLDRLTEQALTRNGGRAHATKFLQQATIHAGDVHDLKPAVAELTIKLHWPIYLDCTGILRADAIGQRGPLQLQMRVVRSGDDWQINDVFWAYRRGGDVSRR
jgi:hypothetical protein